MLIPIQFDCVTPAMCLYNLIPSSLILSINIDLSRLTQTDIDILSSYRFMRIFKDSFVLMYHDMWVKINNIDRYHRLLCPYEEIYLPVLTSV